MRQAVKDAGGLFVLATERHEIPPYRQPACAVVLAVRVIRARSAFFLSLEDDLMRIFGSERLG